MSEQDRRAGDARRRPIAIEKVYFDRFEVFRWLYLDPISPISISIRNLEQDRIKGVGCEGGDPATASAPVPGGSTRILTPEPSRGDKAFGAEYGAMEPTRGEELEQGTVALPKVPRRRNFQAKLCNLLFYISEGFFYISLLFAYLFELGSEDFQILLKTVTNRVRKEGASKEIEDLLKKRNIGTKESPHVNLEKTKSHTPIQETSKRVNP